MRSLFFVCSLLLSGCSAVPGYEALHMTASGYVDKSITDKMAYEDREGQVIDALSCELRSLGAYSRMPEGDIKRGVALICGIK